MRKWIVFNLWLIVALFGLLLITLQPIGQCGHQGAVTNIRYNQAGDQALILRRSISLEHWSLNNLHLEASYPLDFNGSAAKKITFTPDGKTAMILNWLVMLWDVQTGNPLPRLPSYFLGAEDSVLASDGKTITTVFQNGLIASWDVPSATLLRQCQLPQRVAEHSFGLSPDGSALLSKDFNDFPGERHDPTPNIWDTRTCTRIGQLNGYENTIHFARFSPNGKLFLTNYGFGNSLLFDTQTGILQFTLTGAMFGFQSSVFSPDSKMVLVQSGLNSVGVWDTRSGTLLRQLQTQSDVNVVGFSPDGKIIFTSETNQTIVFWDAQTGIPFQQLPNVGKDLHVAVFSPDSKTLLTGWNSAMLWDVQTGTLRHTLPIVGQGKPPSDRTISSAAFAPDSKTVLVGQDNGVVHLWDVDTGTLKIALGHDIVSVEDVAFTPDGRTLLAGITDRNTLVLVDLATGTVQQELKGQISPIRKVIFSPDQRLVISATSEGSKVWDVQTGTLLHTLTASANRDSRLMLAPDHQTLAIRTNLECSWVSLWDLQMECYLRDLGSTCDVAFTPDGKTMLTANAKSPAAPDTFQMHDVRTGRLLNLFQGRLPAGKSYTRITISPDGKNFLTGGNNGAAALWDTETGATLHTLTGHQASITAVAFAPDGKTVLTGDDDGLVILWDAHTGERIRPMCPLVIEPTPWRLAGGALISLVLVTAIITLRRVLH